MDPTHDPAFLHHFAFAHLPPHLAAASAPFHHAAQGLAAGHRWALLEVETLAAILRATPGEEAAEGAAKLAVILREAERVEDVASSRGAWLRLLLEAKDCAVRAALGLQRVIAPVAHLLRSMPEVADDVAGSREDLQRLADVGAVGEVSKPDAQGMATARITATGRRMVELARATQPTVQGGGGGACEPGSITITSRKVAEAVPRVQEALADALGHEETGEHYGPGLHTEAPPEMHAASEAFEAGRRSTLQG